jgi:protoheme IX farnesyltransferase
MEDISSLKGWVITYRSLFKMKISLFAALSSATGYILATDHMGLEVISLFAGIFLLGCGSCALNQYQEHEIDGLMERTKNRPIPSQRLRPRRAFLCSLSLISLGLLILLTVGNVALPALGLCAVIWYNGVYTYLKKVNPFALIPGAVIGALPPYMGWVAGGGAFADPRIVALCFFFFVWQVPHFWLLLLNHGDEYEKAGLPSLSRIFNKTQLRRITFIWILAVAVACMLMPLFVTFSLLMNYLVVGAALWLCWNGLKLLKGEGERHRYFIAFRSINIYLFSIMLVITVERFLIVS